MAGKHVERFYSTWRIFLEVGLLLRAGSVVAFWERNYFGRVVFRRCASSLRNNFVARGVSGLGIVNLLIGVSDLSDTAHGPPVWPIR